MEDERFVQGDRIVRARLTALAAEHGVGHVGIELTRPYPGACVYRLSGTRLSIALREREIRYAAASDTRVRFVEPRLRAMFQELWWGQALVLMGLR